LAQTVQITNWKEFTRSFMSFLSFSSPFSFLFAPFLSFSIPYNSTTSTEKKPTMALALCGWRLTLAVGIVQAKTYTYGVK